jgi:magnesium-transporting ATPase (P-type)
MKPNEKVIDKREFSEIDEGLFRADIKKYKVFLSLGAEEREKVIKFRKSDGDIVATTASGIADIPLQLESDVAFCNEGVRDDTVVRNSDVVLTKGFDAVPECIKYARSVYRNIRHLLEFLMLTQFTLASCAFMMLLFLPQISFEPVQIVLFSTLVFMPLSFVLANEKVRGTELRAGFGEENVNINFQNLITVPLIC